MGRTFEAWTPALRGLDEARHRFFVACAPAGGEGDVDLRTKGHDSSGVIDGLPGLVPAGEA